MTTTGPDDAILALALDLTASLPNRDRAQRVVDVVARVLGADAACLLRFERDELVPIAMHGLSADARGRCFRLAEHPRLAAICASNEPVVFGPDETRPDPYDGMIGGAHDVHACLGAALRVDGSLVGALTADAIDPRAFDGVDRAFLAKLAALAGAALRTIDLIDALERRAAQQGLIARDLLDAALDARGGELLGQSRAMARVREEIDLFGRTDFAVLITGETGVGKELVARMLHRRSLRAERQLVHVNCAALPEAVAESELFGHVRGAFTGAETERIGKFGVADGGTIFLDEVGELSTAIQAKLLRVLQHGEVQRVGSDRPVHVDVRVLAATNRDLDVETSTGRFRTDLLHRLTVCRVHVPPLREHPEDIALLAGHFADQRRRQLGLGPIRFEPQALLVLARGRWPGNVRELDNLVSRAILRAARGVEPGAPVRVSSEHFDQVDGDAVSPPVSAVCEPAPPPYAGSIRDATDEFQRRMLRDAVVRARGNWAAAARELGLDAANLHRIARRLGLK